MDSTPNVVVAAAALVGFDGLAVVVVAFVVVVVGALVVVVAALVVAVILSNH